MFSWSYRNKAPGEQNSPHPQADPAAAPQDTLPTSHTIETSHDNSFRPRRFSSSAESRIAGGGQLVMSNSSQSSAESLRRLAVNATANKTPKDPNNNQDTETKPEPSDAPAESDELEPKAQENEPAQDAPPPPNDQRYDPDTPESWYKWAWKAPTKAWFSRKTGQHESEEAASEHMAEDAGEPKSNESDKLEPDFKSRSRDGNGWAFWAKRRSSSDGKVDEGELAISGTETANNPREVTLTEDGEQKSKQRKRRKPTRPSLVVPEFETSFDWQTQSSRFISSLSKLGVWHDSKLYRTNPHVVRKAVVIGVHGYFPARVTRAILGEPTGTSIKFASEASQILEEWAESNGMTLTVDKIALEGEGKIQHRVNTLYKLLLNWQTLIKEADFVFFAVHSQGMVVSVHIIAQLIADGYLSNSQKVGLLGMAGACLGPMPGMDQTYVMKAISTIENDSLLELFELQNTESTLSKHFTEAFGTCLKHGVKASLVGSADDQLIPLYSALCAHIDHPNIYRAVYIDGEDMAPDVITPLLTLALKKRNTGQTDHGVILEISNPLAGALTGKGHSKLYSSRQVYSLAIDFFLQTSFSYNTAPTIDEHFKMPRHNPYVLPWALHALIADSEAKPVFGELVTNLYDDFRRWRPETKPMKDLKYRLEALQKAARL